VSTTKLKARKRVNTAQAKDLYVFLVFIILPLFKIEFGWKFNLRSCYLIKDYSFGTERSTRIKDYHLKGCMEEQKCKSNISGRSKRNIPLPILKNEPMGRKNEYTWSFPRIDGHS